MTNNQFDLYTRLMEAYSDASLNRITAGLLTLYRSRQHEKLRALARKVSTLAAVGRSIRFMPPVTVMGCNDSPTSSSPTISNICPHRLHGMITPALKRNIYGRAEGKDSA